LYNNQKEKQEAKIAKDEADAEAEKGSPSISLSP